jgi:hypothetical protein
MLIPLFDYEKDRIIMQTPFIFKGKEYLHYPDGVKFFSLYRTTRRINTFAELEYIAEKFIWLNEDFNIDKMKIHFNLLSERQNGHIIRTYGQNRVENMVQKVFDRKKEPYCPKLRKIIFNPMKIIEKKEKMRIVGMLVGRKSRPTNDQINDAIEDLWLDKTKITVSSVAKRLNKSRHLVKWFFDKQQLSTLEKINTQIKSENDLAKAIEAIDVLTEGGNKLKMRELKKFTSIRNYSVLKKAIFNYQKGV